MLFCMADGGVGILAAFNSRRSPVCPRISRILMLFEPMSTLRYGSSRLRGLRSDNEALNRRPSRLAQSAPEALKVSNCTALPSPCRRKTAEFGWRRRERTLPRYLHTSHQQSLHHPHAMLPAPASRQHYGRGQRIPGQKDLVATPTFFVEATGIVVTNLCRRPISDGALIEGVVEATLG